MRRRVLVLSSSVPNADGRPRTGGGLRTAQLIETCRLAGHDTRIAIEAAAQPGEGQRSFTPESIAQIVDEIRPDIVIVEQWAMLPHVPQGPWVVAVDLHGSLLLENLHRRGGTFDPADAGAKIDALRAADRVFVPSESQRHWFAAWLIAAGFDPRDLPIDVLPLATPALETQAPPQDAGLSLLYAGARWPWIDSESALLAAATTVAALRSAGLHAQLHISAWEPPGHGLATDSGTWPRTERLLRAYADQGTTWDGGLPHDQYQALLCARPWVALDLWEPNAERRLATTTRVVEWLAAGIPVITLEGSAWAGPLRTSGAGWVVRESEDLDSLLRDLARSPDRRIAAAAAARALHESQHRPEPAGLVLARFLAQPTRPPRAPATVVDLAAAERVAHEHDRLRSLEAAHADEHRRLISNHRDEVAALRAAHAQESCAQRNDHLAEQARAASAHHQELLGVLDTHRLAQLEAEARWTERQRAAEAGFETRLLDAETRAVARAEKMANQHDEERARIVASFEKALAERVAERDLARAEGAEALSRAHDQALRLREASVARLRQEADAELRAVELRSKDDRAALEASWQQRLETLESRVRHAEDDRAALLAEIAELRARDGLWERRAREAEDREREGAALRFADALRHQEEQAAIVRAADERIRAVAAEREAGEAQHREHRRAEHEGAAKEAAELRATIERLSAELHHSRAAVSDREAAELRHREHRQRDQEAAAREAVDLRARISELAGELEQRSAATTREKPQGSMGVRGRLQPWLSGDGGPLRRPMAAARLVRLWADHAADRG